jgi:LPXTG-motif cell wall-anchored protein
VIQYTNVDLEDAIAGETIIADDGTFSVVTNFLGLAPGAVEVRTLTSGFSQSGVELVTGRVATLFFFEVAPVSAPNAASITIQPESITVSDVTDPARGVRLSATGFERNETLTTRVVDSTGTTATLRVAPPETADESGSIVADLVLAGTVTPGVYTVTVSGATSGLVQRGTFTVIADPAPVGPVPPVSPAAVGVVAVTPPAAVKTGMLAETGTDQAQLLSAGGLAALLTLAGGAVLFLRRKLASGSTRG